MKSKIVIKFPSRNLKDIVIYGSLAFTGDRIMLDIGKEVNSKEICPYHCIEGIKLEGVNRNTHPDLLKDYQVFHFSGYYRNTKSKSERYIRCEIEYSINNYNLKLK